jgi:transcriptional regulator of heat shock response
VARALGERIRGNAAARMDAAVRDELQGLREDLATELQQVRQQMGELSDRVEFTERLIAKQRIAQRVGPGE